MVATRVPKAPQPCGKPALLIIPTAAWHTETEPVAMETDLGSLEYFTDALMIRSGDDDSNDGSWCLMAGANQQRQQQEPNQPTHLNDSLVLLVGFHVFFSAARLR